MKAAIGQDSHRFEENISGKPCVLGGILFEGMPAFLANSDGDVVLHAITNAVSGITGRIILGPVADKLCRSGITDSRVYLEEALKDLKEPITHLSITIEGKRPKITPRAEEMRASIASILKVPVSAVCVTATTGEGLTDFGRGLGVSVFCILTVG